VRTGLGTDAASLARRTNATRLGSSPNVAESVKQARKTLSAGGSSAATLASRRAYLVDLLASSASVASLTRSLSALRAAASLNVAALLRRATRLLSATDAQVGSVTRSTAKTWQATSGSAGTFTISGRASTFTATSVQVAYVDRFVSSVRLGVSANSGVRRVFLPRVLVAASDDAASLSLVVVPLSFKLTRFALHVDGGDEAATTSGSVRSMRSSGVVERLTTSGRSGTLTTTGK
jgi:hypothetical protein